MEGHKPHCDNCSSEKIVCNLCFTILLGREDEGIKKCVSLKALRILDRMDVETALEIHRKGVKNSIPDEKVSTTLVPELESKRWKKNGLSLLSYPVGLTFSPKHSRPTKELTGTLPYALSMRPSIITASSEDCHDVTTAFQTEDVNVVLQGRTVRVQTVYHIGSRCCET